MVKVWVVMSHGYDWYSVMGVYSSQAEANAKVKSLHDREIRVLNSKINMLEHDDLVFRNRHAGNDFCITEHTIDE